MRNVMTQALWVHLWLCISSIPTLFILSLAAFAQYRPCLWTKWIRKVSGFHPWIFSLCGFGEQLGLVCWFENSQTVLMLGVVAHSSLQKRWLGTVCLLVASYIRTELGSPYSNNTGHYSKCSLAFAKACWDKQQWSNVPPRLYRYISCQERN